MRNLRIGIDFDNTIAGYDCVFQNAAIARGWLPPDFPEDKRQIRDALRLQPDGERRWMALQGEVYGPRMAEACMLDGVSAFLRRCRQDGVHVVVVSHKTEKGHFDPTGTDLRVAARQWMTGQGFFDPNVFGLRPRDVHFESTREAKIDRIANLECQIFIDDLEEVLLHPAFPPSCRKLHLAGEATIAFAGLERCRDWDEILHVVFG